jgi:hypothetical protein
VVKRAGDAAFWPDAMRCIIQASGGLFRELVSLARHACLLAERAKQSRVSTMEALHAMTEQRLRYTSTLTPGDRDLLSQFSRPDRDRTIADQSIFEQVNQGKIVYYHRDSPWFDIHPILWPLMGLSFAD